MAYEASMARVNELPPVPDTPERPPVVSIAGEERIDVVASDGTKLEARIVVPAGARRVAVLAHPHPLYGGSMHNAVIVALAKVVSERGCATLRFNFRGVGESEGAYDAGAREVLDVIGALQAAAGALPGAAISALGYSFGSWVTLAAARRRVIDVERVALIGPAARLFDFHATDEHGARFEGPMAIVLGDDDEFCDVAEAEKIAYHLGAPLTIVPGADHYFLNGRRRLAERVAPFLVGDVDAIERALPT